MISVMCLWTDDFLINLSHFSIDLSQLVIRSVDSYNCFLSYSLSHLLILLANELPHDGSTSCHWLSFRSWSFSLFWSVKDSISEWITTSSLLDTYGIHLNPAHFIQLQLKQSPSFVNTIHNGKAILTF